MHQWDSTDFLVETPMNIRFVKYNAANLELRVTADFTWFPSEEESLRKQLLAKFVDAGRNVSPEAITFTPIIPEAFRLLLRDGNHDLELFTTDIPSRMISKTVTFHLPMMTPDAEHLHKMLSDKETQQAIRLSCGRG